MNFKHTYKGSVSSKEIEDEVLKIIEEIEYELSKFLKNRLKVPRRKPCNGKN